MGIFSGSSSGQPTVCPPPPDPQNGTDLVLRDWTAHQFFVVLSGAFAAAACLISLLLLFLHGIHFSNPQEQSKILRIVSFFPLFAVIAFCDLLLGENSVYLLPWASAYEAFALASYFMLVNVFISPNHDSEAAFFDNLRLKDGKIAGAAWFARARMSTFQYTPVALILAVATDITFAAGVYCDTQNSVHYAKIWLTVIKGITTTVAAMAAITFTLRARPALKHRKIMSKLVSFKIIIGLETIQTLVFNILKGKVTSTTTLGYVDITVGIPSLLLCIELFVISIVLHITYPWSPYKLRGGSASGRYRGLLSAILAAMNPAEIIREFAYGFGLSSPPQSTYRYDQSSVVPLRSYEPLTHNSNDAWSDSRY